MNYAEIKKLDEESLQQLTEGSGPSDQCYCSLLSPPDAKKGIRASIKRAFASFSAPGKRRMTMGEKSAAIPPASGKTRTMGQKSVAKPPASGRTRRMTIGQKSIDIPLTFTKGAKGAIYTTKEVVQRNSSCGKCGCDRNKVVLKHSYANIRIISPDISSICPCPSDCLPGKAKLMDNIKVTVERMTFDRFQFADRQTISEPAMEPRKMKQVMPDDADEWTDASSTWDSEED